MVNTTSQKDELFLSYALPEDKYFASWLATKLRMLGYKVWMDLHNISSGENFWTEIEERIKNKTIRFLSIVSKDYALKSQDSKSGVNLELRCASTVRDIEAFVIPIRLDDTLPNEFPMRLLDIRFIDFSQNWAVGLRELIKQLKESKIPQSEVEDNPIKFWFDSLDIQTEVIERKEDYYSNWFKYELPPYIYLHEPELFIIQEFRKHPFSFVREGDWAISFYPPDEINDLVPIRDSKRIKTEDFIFNEEFEVNNDFTIIDPKKKLVRLLNQTFKDFLFKKGLRRYKQANRKDIFYFSYSTQGNKMVSLKRLGRTGRAVNGKKKDNHWHFCISSYAKLEPFPHFIIDYHIITTTKEGRILPPDKQQKFRKSVPTDWYNRDWFERLLAFWFNLLDDVKDEHLIIPVGTSENLLIEILPTQFSSEVGYKEPKKNEQ